MLMKLSHIRVFSKEKTLNTSKYLVLFVTGLIEIVNAFSPQEATILAQAEQIKKGNIYEVKKVLKDEN